MTAGGMVNAILAAAGRLALQGAQQVLSLLYVQERDVDIGVPLATGYYAELGLSQLRVEVARRRAGPTADAATAAVQT